MFTGIVQALGKVTHREQIGGDLRLTVDAASLVSVIDANRLARGESVAVNGVCLTVVTWADRCFVADVSLETLSVTTLGGLAVGASVNLEAALRAADPLGGHIMSGHVDGVASVVALQQDARSMRVEVAAPADLASFIAAKGSVALDGVSLTVNSVAGNHFGVNLIPHTVAVTTLRNLAPGQQMNLEIDLLARYVRRGLLHLRS